MCHSSKKSTKAVQSSWSTPRYFLQGYIARKVSTMEELRGIFPAQGPFSICLFKITRGGGIPVGRIRLNLKNSWVPSTSSQKTFHEILLDFNFSDWFIASLNLYNVLSSVLTNQITLCAHGRASRNFQQYKCQLYHPDGVINKNFSVWDQRRNRIGGQDDVKDFFHASNHKSIRVSPITNRKIHKDLLTKNLKSDSYLWLISELPKN